MTSTISYPGTQEWGSEAIPKQSLPKVLTDLCLNFGIESDFSILETLRPIEDRCVEGRKQHRQNPAVEKRKKTEMLYQANETTIAELTSKQTALEQQRIDDAESGKQNLDALDELSSIKTKLEILIAENDKINERIFDDSRIENHAYAEVLKNLIRDETYHERCEIRSRLLDEIERVIKENSAVFAQFIAIDSNTDFSRIESEVRRGLNI